MIMQICAQIISVCSGNAHMADDSVLRQTVQIAVHGSVAYLRVGCVDVLIYLLRRRVVVS